MTKKQEKQIKVLTIGGAVQDIFFHTSEGVLVDNRQDLLRQKLVGFEYGAKIYIDSSEADFSFGGGAANTAISFSRLGWKVASLVAVGDDKTGEAVLENLKKEDVDVSLAQTTNKPSGMSCAVVFAKKISDHVLFAYRGASEDLRLDSKDLEKIKPDLIYTSSLSGRHWTGVLNKISAYVKKNKVSWAFNPGSLQIKAGVEALGAYLKNVSVLLVNRDEALELLVDKMSEDEFLSTKKLAAMLGEYCHGVVVVTDGEKGACAWDSKRAYFRAIKKVQKNDTTGVGDAFGSTFVWALEFFKGDVRAALETASINAAAVIIKKGAQNGLLKKTQLLKKL